MKHRQKFWLSFTLIKAKESEMSFVVPSSSLEFNIKCSFDPIFQDYHFKTRHKVEAFGIEKTNKLSFKCWEESGREPGVAIGHRVDITEIESCSGIALV